MRTMVIAALLTTLVTCLTGCESPGRSLAKSAVDRIRDGTTTREEIVTIFGEPKEMTKSHEGKTLFYYDRFYGPSAQASAFSDESHMLALSILFNPRDVVEKHLYSHTNPDVNRRSMRVGRKLSAHELARIVPGRTTRAELSTWFGPHWSERLTFTGGRQLVWLYADGYTLASNVALQALEVLVDEAGTVQNFRTTNRGHAN